MLVTGLQQLLRQSVPRSLVAIRPITTSSGKSLSVAFASLWGVFHLRTSKTPEATTPVMPYRKQQLKAARKAAAAKNKNAHAESEEPNVDRGDLASAGSNAKRSGKGNTRCKLPPFSSLTIWARSCRRLQPLKVVQDERAMLVEDGVKGLAGKSAENSWLVVLQMTV